MRKIIFAFFVILFFFKNFYLIQHGFFDDKARFFNDFHAYYVGSYLFWHGENPYDLKGAFTTTAQNLKLDFLYGTGYSYPPLIAFAFYPLIKFPPLVAARIFAGITMLLYLFFCFLIFQERKKATFFKLLVLAIYLATFFPATESANHGQVNLVVLLCIYLYFKIREEQKWSSLFLTTAILIKVYPVFFLIKEFCEKKFKFIVHNLAWGIIFFVTLGIAGGFNLWKIYFFQVLPKINSSLDAYYTNQSVNGFLSRVFLTSNKTYLVSQATYQPIIIGITLLSLSFLIYITIRKRVDKKLLFLIWLGTISILAGKNSFSNLTPCVLIGIYLIDNFHELNRTLKILFIFSVLLTNFFWAFVWNFNQSFILQNNFFSKLQYVSFTSLGFFTMIIQITILISLVYKTRYDNNHV